MEKQDRIEQWIDCCHTIKVLHKAGFKDIEVITLDNMRHEILNELDHQLVYDHILKFLDE